MLCKKNSTDHSLWQAFDAAQRARRQAAVLSVPGGPAFDWPAIDAHGARLAGWMRQQGLRPGDRVTLQAPKSPAWLGVYLACLRGGFVFHPLNEAYAPGELRWFCADAAPAMVICTPERAERFREFTAGSGTRIETLDADGGGTLMARAADATPWQAHQPCNAGDPAVLLYSSGTTGRPKGALLSHGNLLSNARTLVDAWAFGPADCLLHALPVYHAHGLFVAVGCTLLSGASMCFLPRFDVDAVIAALPGCSVMMGVPTYYTRLLATPAFDATCSRTVRLFISGSAPLRPETFHAFEARTGQRILERYGMTETGMNSANPLHGERRPGTVGPPLKGVEIRITGDDGGALPAGHTGAIEIRGPNVFTGYRNRPAENAAAFTADGWFRSGDLGRFDADGYLSIVGRQTDLIISGGLNVYPREVEMAIDTLPGVAESAVIGVPHDDFGEAVVAVVVPQAGAAPDAAGLAAALRDELAAYKVPKRVFFATELPRNALGKVEKHRLRALHAGTFNPRDMP